MKERRKKNRSTRLLAALICWVVLTGIVYFVEPGGLGPIGGFLIVLFAGMFFTASIVFNHLRRSLLMALFVAGYMTFRYLGLGTILNAILLGGFLITIEVYLSKYRVK